jgi:putative hemolysin
VVPVQDGEPDSIVGVIVRKDLLDLLFEGKPVDARELVKQAPVVMDRSDALDVLKAIRGSLVHMALVFDEYGHFEGIVTPADVLEAIAGVFRSDAELEEPHAVSRDDGSWLLSGAMPADEMAEQLGITLPAKRDYHTAAGFLLAELRRLPAIGESVEAYGWRFEIVDLDGRRIDKVLAIRRVAGSRRQLG